MKSSIAGRGGRTSLLLACGQQNSAVNRKPIARTPAEEMALAAVAKQGFCDDGGASGRPRRKGKAGIFKKNYRIQDDPMKLKRDERPKSKLKQKLSHSLFANCKTDDDYDQIEENSVVDRDPVIRDPRLERQSFRRRRTVGEESKPVSQGLAVGLEVEAGRGSPGSETLVRDPSRERTLIGGGRDRRELIDRRDTTGHGGGPSGFEREQESRRNTMLISNSGLPMRANIPVARGGFKSFLEDDDDDESKESATKPCVPGGSGRGEEDGKKRAMQRHTSGAGASSSSFGSSFRDMEDGEPVTKPSEPARRRRPNRSAVNEARANLMKLNEDAGAENVVGSMTEGANRQKFRNSLRECLEGMGFDPEDIQTAIVSTNAESSDDAAKVVEWLGDHGGKSGKQTVAEDVDDETISVRSGDETNYTKHTQGTDNTNNTDNTETTQESNEGVRELKSSLRNLGFSKDDITRHKELYRRHSNKIDAQVYICIMMDTAEDNEEEDGCCPAPPADIAPAPIAHMMERPRKSEESRRVDRKSNLRANRKDGELVRSMTEMGFEKDKVQCAIDDLRRSGLTVSTEDADKVLSALLAGANPGAKCERSQSSRDFSEKDEEEDRRQICSERMAGSVPQERQTLPTRSSRRPRCEGKSMSIEISPGQYARLLRGLQTWNALHDGTAVSAKCTICGATLQCTPEADYVLCPDCDVVSPLSHKETCRRTTAGGRFGSVGLGYKRE